MQAESEPGSGSEPGISERYYKTSPWPVVIVIGLVASEIGILFNLYPVAVTGLILFVGSVSGIVHEAGYVASPWRLVAGLGATLVFVGLAIVSTQVDGGAAAYAAQVAADNGVSQRGFSIAATGIVLTVAGVVLPRTLHSGRR
ncbi:MAG: cox cluster protein [Natronomonas sp.]